MGSTINKLIGTIVPIVAILVAAVIFLPTILNKISSFKADQQKAQQQATQDQKDTQNGFLGFLADNIFGQGTADSIRTSLGFGTPDSNPTNAGSSTTKDTTIATDKTQITNPTNTIDNSSNSSVLAFFKSLADSITGKSNTDTSPSGETVKTDTSVKTDKNTSTDNKNVSDSKTNAPDTSITRSESETAKALADFFNLPNEKVITPSNKIPGVDLGGNIVKSATDTFKQLTQTSTPSITKPVVAKITRDPFDSGVQL